MIIKRTSSAVVAAAALLVLAGCSGGGSADDAGTNDAGAGDGGTSDAGTNQQTTAPAADQSKAEACEIVQTQFQKVSEAGSSMNSSDPEAAMATFTQLATDVNDAFGSITNAEVAPAATQASNALNDYVAFLEGVTTDPSSIDGLSGQVTALQESFTQAATACAG